MLVHDTDAAEPGKGPEPDDSSQGTAKVSAMRFRLAVARHHRTIFRVCQGLLRDAHEAEDVTQETFVKYWQLGSEVRGTKAWLITVARNKCLDRLRSTRRLVDADPEFFEQQADERDPEWHASRDQKAARLTRLIDNLPEPQRSLILLFDVEGLTGSECAEALGLNVNQVKVYLHRARKQLRRALEEHNE